MSKKVALMCGHGRSTNGSWDCGTSYGGNNEAALMLPITKAAVKYLRSWGVKVISDADTNNNKNMIVDVRWANKEKCDIYVSLHCDWYKAGSGTLPLYVSSKGKTLATAMNKVVMKDVGIRTRGVCRRTDLWELNGTDMPACIFETGSIKADIKILKNKSDVYGKAIAKGICNYLGVKIPTSTAKPAETKPANTATLYRVRKSWNDVNSQVGAYKDLDNAKKIADEKHLNVYGQNGKLVYEGKKKVTNTKPTTAKKPATSTTNAQKIVVKAKEYAWPSGTSAKKWAYKTGSARSTYKAALKKYMGHSAKVSQSDCGYFVSTCVRAAGVSKSFLALKGNKDPFPAVPSTMKVVHKGKKIPSGTLRPGDIIRYKKKSGSQHTLMYYGGGKIAEAGRKIRFPIIRKDTHKYNSRSVKIGTLQVIRAK